MKKLMAFCLVIIAVIVAVKLIKSTNGIDDKKLTAALEEKRKQQGLVGLGVALLKDDNVVYSHGFGLMNIERNKPVDANSIFLLASVSKIVTGLALMKLVDQGKIKSLDDPINNYLPKDSQIINPLNPERAITFRDLLTHTSGVTDTVYKETDLDVFGKDQPDGAFADIIKDYFFKGGKYYEKGVFEHKSGAEEDYANMGSGLIGYLVQVISGMPFNEFCKKYIFEPLGMKNTGWLLKEVNLQNLAMPYERGARPKAYGHYTFPDYPSGQLMTSVDDFSKLILMLMNGGTLNNVQILKPETAKLMLTTGTVQATGAEDWGMHIHEHKIQGFDNKFRGHEGSEKGVSSSVVFDPQKRIGAIVITNTDDEKFKGESKAGVVDDVNLDTILTLLLKAT